MTIILSCIAGILFSILITLVRICDAISDLPERLKRLHIGTTPVESWAKKRNND